VNRNVALAQAGMDEVVLPARVQEALGQLVGSAKEGLLALSVGVGLGVLVELLEEEVVGVVGAKGKHDRDRVAVRHGHEPGEVTLGGRRVQVERPRVRSADGSEEVRLATYEHFASRDALARVVMERMLASVSTRRYSRTGEPVGSDVEAKERSTSKSAVSRTFVERTRRSLGELMSRRLDDVRLAVMMIDGLELQGRTNVVALGITTEGVKIPLGLWEGSTENATVATALLSDLVERGLDPEQGILFVIDGAKALRKAIRNVFGQAPVQRCVRHKECHEEGPPAGADFCVGDNPEGGPWCSSMSDSIGDTDAPAGARRRATGRCSRRIGRRRTRTGSAAWLHGLALT
jgi:putative transposase